MMDLSFTSGRVLVIGDVMLDSYVHGSADRLSPEAPVPVLRWARDQKVPGGAANVAANIAALGGAVSLVGIVGDDEGGAELEAALAAFGDRISPAFLVDHRRPTTVKLRLVAGGQQLLRLDREDAAPVSPELEARLIALVSEQIGAADVVVLSDYRKGLLTDTLVRHTVEACRAANRLLIVDPKRRQFDIYRGAGVLTPNRRELAEATGLPVDTNAEVEAAGAVAAEATGAAILVTRSEKGMSLIRAGQGAVHLPTTAREVFDVSGAGDTVVAALALAIAAHVPLAQAMRIANASAGVVVRKHGTATLTRAELDRALKAEGSHATEGAEVADLSAAVRLRQLWREQAMVVGFTNGCFDILHPGHIRLLEEAARHCDRLIVALNSDASVRRLKGPSRPIQDELARARVMGAISFVDAVILFEEDTPLEVIERLQPDLLVKGSDYREDEVVGADTVKLGGGRVLLIDLAEGHSTSRLVARSRV